MVVALRKEVRIPSEYSLKGGVSILGQPQSRVERKGAGSLSVKSGVGLPLLTTQ